MVEVPGDTHTTTCTRLPLRDGKHLFLRIKWYSTSFFVTALDFPHSWSYNVTKQEIERRASTFGVIGEEYLSHTRSYLGECGAVESEYCFERALRNGMRLSWTTPWTTTNMKFDEERRMVLYLDRDNNPMELVPEFLNALADMTLMVQDEARRKKYSKHNKARVLALRFSAAERVRSKRILSREAPGRKVVREGLDGSVVRSESAKSTPIFNPSAVSYGLPFSPSTPAHPPILTALDARAPAHELRTPPMQFVSSSMPLNLGMYNAGRLVSDSPLYGHQTPFCFDRSHVLGMYVPVSHGQLENHSVWVPRH